MKKVVIKDLCFFSTGERSNEDTTNIRVVCDKDTMYVHCHTLLSNRRSSDKRTHVVSVLQEKCEQLTIAQHTGDCFVNWIFQFTVTIGSSFLMNYIT